ncbi:sarcosine oxidase subunit gamma [Roseinatronobacter alkalisoli]|uniref:Sarcosine oxidase subunit gamma n=1 Tax=Roseinatronobacter alkalisoli TaxID=3028235 RepID=A0ABT5T6I4_9RHOB|nr:sarcosine oxidase subunit gamma [Roseinatronobacter sp. HJB301]MDD7970723.1 sarcosine oxidase subunit gamma [Roseinatronobacter sp. HJB301]
MHDLTPLTALGSGAPQTDTIGPVTISENPDSALVSVAARLGQEAACARVLAAILGVPAPDVAQFVQGATLGAFWTAQHCWMVDGPDDPQAGLSARLKAELGDMASVTDQSVGWVRFDLQGDGLGVLFERLCNLDMARMPTGSARRSVIEHLGCFVLHRDGGYTVYGPRSSAQSLHHALVTAARSVF